MFTSHKKDAPPNRSEQSVASSVTGYTLPASAPGTLNTQCLDDGPFGVMPSTEQSHRPFSSKRNSVFNLRARSNTATSASSTMSFTSSNPADLGYADTSRPESPLAFISPVLTAQSESGSRKSMFRGRKGKRLSHSVSSGIQTTEYDEASVGTKRTSVLRKGKKRDIQLETPCKFMHCAWH